jgi:hypothetical protein
VCTDLVEFTPIPVSVRKAGRDIFVTNLSAAWDVTMDSVMPQTLMVFQTSVSVNLVGEETTVKNADPTGIAPTKMPMPATCQTNVSVLEERQIPRAFATTPCLFKD